MDANRYVDFNFLFKVIIGIVIFVIAFFAVKIVLETLGVKVI